MVKNYGISIWFFVFLGINLIILYFVCEGWLFWVVLKWNSLVYNIL